MEHYARLNVYFGLCDSVHMREGKFDSTSKIESEQQRYATALQEVRQYFERGWDFGIHMSQMATPLFDDRKKAESFCAYAQTTIPDASPAFELVDYMHGKIRFYRVVRFEGWMKRRKNHLVTLLHTSGFEPRFEERERLQQAFDMTGLDRFRTEIDALDLTTPWKERLSFH